MYRCRGCHRTDPDLLRYTQWSGSSSTFYPCSIWQPDHTRSPACRCSKCIQLWGIIWNQRKISVWGLILKTWELSLVSQSSELSTKNWKKFGLFCSPLSRISFVGIQQKLNLWILNLIEMFPECNSFWKNMLSVNNYHNRDNQDRSFKKQLRNNWSTKLEQRHVLFYLKKLNLQCG